MDIYKFIENLEFDWDEGNSTKNYSKHKIINSETEECFYNLNIILPDEAHSRTEKRYRLVGQTDQGKVLFIAFTIRNFKVRVISARPASLREKQRYEQTKKNTTI